MRILAAGGGTGGHLFPALAVLEEFQKRHRVEIAYVVSKGRIDDILVPREHPSYRILRINARGLYRPLYSAKNVKRVFQYALEVSRVKRFVRNFNPDFVFLTGGYVAGIVAMAVRSKYPLFIHEQNVFPGKANLYASKFARLVFLSFERTKFHFPKGVGVKIRVVGNPIRDVFYTKRELEIPDGIVLVMGGSLGSDEINSLMERVYELDEENVYYHSVGRNERWKERLSRFGNVRLWDFFDFTPILWRKAKFVVARAGGTTVYEMIRYGVKGILIPWTGSAESHQIENAKEAERAGLATIIEKPDPEKVVEMIREAVYNPKLGVRSVSKDIYKYIMEAIT